MKDILEEYEFNFEGHHLEGHHEVTVSEDHDCDWGKCRGYEIESGRHLDKKLIIYIYDNHPNRISFHIEEKT